MATDAKFDKIQKIVPHDDANSLEIAFVSNFPCVVKKGEFKAGDWCFYIRDDAKLTEFDDYKKWSEEMSKGGMGPNEFPTEFPWQIPLMRYLGSGGRVKTIKLRGKTSMGILLKPEVVWPVEMGDISGLKLLDENYLWFNDRFSDPNEGADYLKVHFGITHWESPITSVGNMNVAYQGLPENIPISDEENWENLEERDLHLGSECVITKKLDGSSCTVTCYPDGKYEISCRRMTFKPEEDEAKMNAYQKLTRDAVKAGVWYAKKFNKIIALRGECCCKSFNKSSYNKDCELNDFFVYGCYFPEEEDWFRRNGIFGTENHFIHIVGKMRNNGYPISSVPVIGYTTISRDILEDFNSRSWKLGEGAVINVNCNGGDLMDSLVWHYKSKSREYLMKMK